MFAVKENKICYRSVTMYCAVILTLCCSILNNPISVLANNGDKQPSKARPVARLVTSVRGSNSRPTVVATAPRTITNRTAPSRAFSAMATSAEMRAFELLNIQRRANNLPPLAWDAELCHLARTHSADMARSGVLNHKGTDGLDPAARARFLGITGWRALGENIAYNQGVDDPVALAVERWMQSAKHRLNILNNGFTHTGLGMAQAADGSVYFTQVFIAR